MELKDCLPFLLHEFKSESDLIRAVEEISQKFTVKREDIGDYLKDPRLVSAYTAFYLTTNFPKLREVFHWLPKEWLEELKSKTFIDLGAGPGTFSLAFREWAEAPVKVIQAETSTVMREQARKLWEGLHPGEPLEQWSKPRSEKGSFLLFGHSANEMGAREAIKYIQEIDPDHILFIEPGTKSFMREILEIRRTLLQKGFNVLFPCPGTGECPMQGRVDDWCHQFIHVRHAQDVERLTQLAKKDRRLLPLTVHAYSKTFAHRDSERIVRVHPETKFSYEWDVCTGDSVVRSQVMKRGLSKKKLKELDEVLAGAALESETDKVLESGRRIRPLKLNNKDVTLDS